MKNLTLKNWHFMRWLRLFAGLTLGIQSLITKDSLPGIIGLFFLVQAITNTGCGRNGSCTIQK